MLRPRVDSTVVRCDTSYLRVDESFALQLDNFWAFLSSSRGLYSRFCLRTTSADLRLALGTVNDVEAIAFHVAV
ncbi:hypothetical protein MSAN_00334200 [Mycena sanguinolenta]|uniref:Uncharacterized protein n=1 Tax=Mycena sanguinolenta TaxID=230812 RepID=A0A8H6ZDW4_9AGAR|nr:hypothetical protein MSAN_00334200 [Mycena sanguinolenta]